MQLCDSTSDLMLNYRTTKCIRGWALKSTGQTSTFSELWWGMSSNRIAGSRRTSLEFQLAPPIQPTENAEAARFRPEIADNPRVVILAGLWEQTVYARCRGARAEPREGAHPVGCENERDHQFAGEERSKGNINGQWSFGRK